ncbi:MAG: primosomal protein N' [Bacteroidaceae bacterium]|nr:primosomal protein N' [Bacteroidaceae bacterium]
MYVDVLVPLPLAGQFTYLLPDALSSQTVVGSRVVVPFGQKRHYTGIVTRLHADAPAGDVKVKDVISVLDPQPIILPRQLKLWEWMADYYLCAEGDVLKAALPSGFHIESDTLEQYYRPRTESRVCLAAAYQGSTQESLLHDVLDGLRRAPKQQALLSRFLELAGYEEGRCLREVSRHELLASDDISASALSTLVEKGILSVYEAEVSRLQKLALSDIRCMPLTDVQQHALEQINGSWQQHDVCLLHGVTSSGKTEIYMHLIQEALQRGQQVLYMMPEIALTSQMQQRLRRVFGGRLGVYHSKFSDAERVEIWKKQLSDEPYDIILGVRSSVFLPFRRLGLVIIDEEHENSYKQQEPAPRYHARNVAIVLASQFGAKTLLGTATPSVESYYNATSGKYGLVTLTQRYQSVQMPDIEIVDIKELRRKHRMVGNFSPRLIAAIRDALSRGEQAILFQNRRGYAPMVECKTCGWVPRCERCDVSLTYHRRLSQLVCHYCGNVYRLPARCPQCEEANLVHIGLGTERIEEELHALIPEARIDRMDLDTTRAKTAYERILDDFAHQRTDVLIGTQMVSKGLDFAHVSVVGIMNADTMLNFPDFRSYERAYQLMAQVAGRAGRRDRQGLVILQTRSTDIPVVSQVRRYDYRGLFDSQLAEREAFRYPPFTRLLFIYLRGRDERRVSEASHAMKRRLDTLFGSRVLGPEAPPVSRVHGLHIRKIMLKLELNYNHHTARQQLHQILADMSAQGELSGVVTHFDVDPM